MTQKEKIITLIKKTFKYKDTNRKYEIDSILEIMDEKLFSPTIINSYDKIETGCTIDNLINNLTNYKNEHGNAIVNVQLIYAGWEIEEAVLGAEIKREEYDEEIVDRIMSTIQTKFKYFD